MNTSLIIAQQSARPAAKAVSNEGNNGSKDAAQEPAERFSGVLTDVRSDDTANNLQTRSETQEKQDKAAIQKTLLGNEEIENPERISQPDVLQPVEVKVSQDKQIPDVNALKKLVGSTIPEKQPGQKVTDAMLQNLTPANGDKTNQATVENPTAKVEPAKPAPLPNPNQSIVRGAELDGKTITQKVLPGQVAEKRLEADIKKPLVVPSKLADAEEKPATANAVKPEAKTETKTKLDLAVASVEKTNSQAPIIPLTRSTGHSEGAAEPVRLVPDNKRDLPQRAGAVNLAVTGKQQETHLPPAAVDQAWNQIGQKITQSLTNVTPLKEGPSSVLTEQTDTSSFTSKTVKYLNIQLKPENLGTVNVKLVMTNGRLEVTLSASDGHLAGRLQQSSSHLTAQFKSSGISFDGLSIQVAESDASTSLRGQNTSSDNNSGQSYNGQESSRQSLQERGGFSQSGNQSTGQRQDAKEEGEDSESMLQHTGTDISSGDTVYI